MHLPPKAYRDVLPLDHPDLLEYQRTEELAALAITFRQGSRTTTLALASASAPGPQRGGLARPLSSPPSPSPFSFSAPQAIAPSTPLPSSQRLQVTPHGRQGPRMSILGEAAGPPGAGGARARPSGPGPPPTAPRAGPRASAQHPRGCPRDPGPGGPAAQVICADLRQTRTGAGELLLQEQPVRQAPASWSCLPLESRSCPPPFLLPGLAGGPHTRLPQPFPEPSIRFPRSRMQMRRLLRGPQALTRRCPPPGRRRHPLPAAWASSSRRQRSHSPCRCPELQLCPAILSSRLLFSRCLSSYHFSSSSSLPYLRSSRRCWPTQRCRPSSKPWPLPPTKARGRLVRMGTGSTTPFDS